MTCNKDRIDNDGCAIKSEGNDNHEDGDKFQTEDAQLLF